MVLELESFSGMSAIIVLERLKFTNCLFLVSLHTNFKRFRKFSGHIWEKSGTASKQWDKQVCLKPVNKFGMDIRRCTSFENHWEQKKKNKLFDNNLT